MYDNYHYPMGADNEDAPWNQEEPPEKDFDISISQTLSKSTTVTTNTYKYYIDEEDGRMYIETDDIDWREVCDDSGVYTPLELIKEFRKFLQENLESVSGIKKYHYMNLIDECDGWIDDETEIIEE